MQHSITSLSNAFYKAAGIFEAPPAMVARLTKATKEVYASAILSRAQANLSSPQLSQEERASFQYLKDLAAKISPIAIKHNGAFNWKMKVDITNWKYATSGRVALFNDIIAIGEIPSYINIRFIFGRHKEEAGHYDHKNNLIVIYINIESNDFHTTLHELEQTVRHELQHFGQSLLSDLTNTNIRYERGYMAGLPSNKIRSKDYSDHGINLKTLERNQEHSLQDVEFYTNLQDNVNIFRKYVNGIRKSPGIVRQFFNMWVGLPNSFLRDAWGKMKNDPSFDRQYKEKYWRNIMDLDSRDNMFHVMLAADKNKWKKAVNVFYTKVSDLLE